MRAGGGVRRRTNDSDTALARVGAGGTGAAGETDVGAMRRPSRPHTSPASRGAHFRPLHPRLASLCSAETVVQACRGILSQNGIEKFHVNSEPRQFAQACVLYCRATRLESNRFHRHPAAASAPGRIRKNQKRCDASEELSGVLLEDVGRGHIDLEGKANLVQTGPQGPCDPDPGDQHGRKRA
jgi:hypothetical protein